jgi:hypothetical protein
MGPGTPHRPSLSGGDASLVEEYGSDLPPMPHGARFAHTVARFCAATLAVVEPEEREFWYTMRETVLDWLAARYPEHAHLEE